MRAKFKSSETHLVQSDNSYENNSTFTPASKLPEYATSSDRRCYLQASFARSSVRVRTDLVLSLHR